MNSVRDELLHLKAVYQQKIVNPTLINPLNAIIKSVAFKFIAIVASFFSPMLGLSIFLYSNLYDFAILTNLDRIINKIYSQILNIFLTPEQRGHLEGRIARDSIATNLSRADGFLSGLLA